MSTSKDDSKQEQDVNEYPSMDVTYEWGRTASEKLSNEASALDTKIMGLFATASIVISVVSTLAKGLKIDWTLTPFVIAGICFIIVFGKSFWALRATKFVVATSPKILKEDWWILEPNVVKIKYWKYIEEDFTKNYMSICAKGRTLQFIVPLTALEVVSLLVWLFLL